MKNTNSFNSMNKGRSSERAKEKPSFAEKPPKNKRLERDKLRNESVKGNKKRANEREKR